MVGLGGLGADSSRLRFEKALQRLASAVGLSWRVNLRVTTPKIYSVSCVYPVLEQITLTTRCFGSFFNPLALTGRRSHARVQVARHDGDCATRAVFSLVDEDGFWWSSDNDV
jgi:hypothetical protein